MSEDYSTLNIPEDEDVKEISIYQELASERQLIESKYKTFVGYLETNILNKTKQIAYTIIQKLDSNRLLSLDKIKYIEKMINQCLKYIHKLNISEEENSICLYKIGEEVLNYLFIELNLKANRENLYYVILELNSMKLLRYIAPYIGSIADKEDYIIDYVVSKTRDLEFVKYLVENNFPFCLKNIEKKLDVFKGEQRDDILEIVDYLRSV
jgi:hypothetical protein